jgi:hypothetical protein
MYTNSSFIYILLASCIFCGCDLRDDGEPVLDDIRITLGVDKTPGYSNPRQFYHIELIMHFEGGSGYTDGIDVLVDGGLVYEQKELIESPPRDFPSGMKLERGAEFWRPVEFDAGQKVLLTIRLHASSGILDEGAEVVVQSGSYAPTVPGNWSQLTDDFYDNSSPDVSPDGKHIAFVRCGDGAPHLYPEQFGQPDIWLLSLGSGEQTRLTNDGELESHLRWSPDGGSIAFVQWPIQINPQPGIYVIPAEPGAQKTLMVTGHSTQFSWIPSGAKWIDTDGNPITPSGDGFLLWTEAVYVSGERIQLYQSGVYHISPDGKWLAVPYGWGEVEGKWTAITKACPVLGLSPCKPLIDGYRGFIRWSPDGEWIGFIDGFREEGHILVKNITTKVLLELTEEKIYNEEGKISWFPDSRRIAFSTRLRGSEDLWILAF